MDKVKLVRANELSKKVEELKKSIEKTNEFEKKLCKERNSIRDGDLTLRGGYSSWPQIALKTEVAETVLDLTTKKLERELLKAETEFKNL